jgi:hypothetical protein
VVVKNFGDSSLVDKNYKMVCLRFSFTVMRNYIEG